MMVHRMVWEAFNGTIPPGQVINHLNGIKSDNRLINLEICTRQENTQHAIRTGLFKPTGPHGGGPVLFGENNPSARLTIKTVKKIQGLGYAGTRGAVIARLLGLKERTVYHVLAGDYWTRTT